MKLPNAVKCIQFCDHQVSEGKPISSLDCKQLQQQPNSRHAVASEDAELRGMAKTSQPSSLESSAYPEAMAAGDHPELVVVEVPHAATESHDQHSLGFKGKLESSVLIFIVCLSCLDSAVHY